MYPLIKWVFFSSVILFGPGAIETDPILMVNDNATERNHMLAQDDLPLIDIPPPEIELPAQRFSGESLASKLSKLKEAGQPIQLIVSTDISKDASLPSLKEVAAAVVDALSSNVGVKAAQGVLLHNLGVFTVIFEDIESAVISCDIISQQAHILGCEPDSISTIDTKQSAF